jgi:hypothetical protein
MIETWVQEQLLRVGKERRHRVAHNLPEPVRKEIFSALVEAQAEDAGRRIPPRDCPPLRH